MKNLKRGIALGTLAAALAAGAYALGLAGTLVIDGRSTPADVRTIGGTAYVRLSDVARALNMTVASRGAGRYELTKSGGANGIGGRTGRVGDTLFDGRWRLTVLSVDFPDQYPMKTDAELYNEGDKARLARASRIVTAGRNYGLVVVKLRVANGTKAKESLWTALSDSRVHTAIADTDGASHPPVAYDFAGAPIQTAPMLPGAGMTFSVVFSLPNDAKPKDLIFTLLRNDGADKGADVRVSLGN